MRQVLTLPALLGLLVGSGFAGTPSMPAPATEALSSPEEDLKLAEASFRKGLYEFVALRLRPMAAREFAGQDRAVLLLAESEYLCGRPTEAEKLLAGYSDRFPKSAHLLEYRLWFGRLAVEHRAGLLKGEERLTVLRDAEKGLRELLADLARAPDGRLDRESLAILTDHCRYYLCLVLVEQGDVEKIDDLKIRSTGAGGGETRRGALSLLEEHMKVGTSLQAEAHVLRGRARYLRGLPDKCFEGLQDDFLDKETYQKPGYGELRAWALYWQAEARYGQARWDEAAGLFSRSAATARSSGSSELASRALYGSGWALEKRAADLRRSGLAGEREALEAALESYREILGRSGDRRAGAARLRAGGILDLLGRQREACEALAPLHGDRELGAEALYLSARSEAGLGRHDQARTFLAEARTKLTKAEAPLAGMIEMASGRSAFDLGVKISGDANAFDLPQWKEAAAAFGRALILAPGNTERYEARLWMARTLAKQGRFEEAIREARELLETVPAREFLRRDCLAYYLGDFLLSMAGAGKTSVTFKEDGHSMITAEGAIAYFNMAREASPLGNFAVPSMLRAARANLMLSPPSLPEAVRLYEEVRRSTLATRDQLIEARMGVARATAVEKRYQKAAIFLQVELLRDAELPANVRREALDLCGQWQAIAGDPESAAETYARLAELLEPSPARTQALLNRSAQLRISGKHAQAGRELSGLAGSSAQESRAEISFLAAEAYRAAGQSAEALKYFLDAVGKDHLRRAQAQVNAAELELEAGRTDRAERLAREAGESIARSGSAEGLLAARAALVRAKALMAAGKAAEAIGPFRLAGSEAAASGDGRESVRNLEYEALMGLGQACLKSGRPEDAASGFLKAAYLGDRETDSEVKARLKARSEESLARAAEALVAAGQDKAAREVRALLDANKSAPATAPKK